MFPFNLLPIRTWIYLAAGAALLAAIALWISNVKADARAEGRAEIQAKWDAETIARQNAAARAAAAALNETQRRLKADQDAQDEQNRRETALQADAARARDAADGLRHRIAALQSASRGAGPADPAFAGQCPAVEALGNALGACAARYLDVAAAADLDRSAGIGCEQRYDSLTENRTPAGQAPHSAP